eukprot:5531587-Pyramimonas_sp.AAC.1
MLDGNSEGVSPECANDFERSELSEGDLKGPEETPFQEGCPSRSCPCLQLRGGSLGSRGLGVAQP